MLDGHQEKEREAMLKRGWSRIEIENFGPIVSGSFELRPLTLFLGRDNTGKSCAAALAHSIVRAVRNGILSPRAPEGGAGSATVQELADRLFSSEGLQEAVLGQLWRSFSGEDLSELISWFSPEGKARIRVCPLGPEDEWIRIEGDGPRWSVQGKAPRLPDWEGRQRIARASADELRRIHRLVAEAMGLPEDSHYLPAARLGALQGWRAMAARAAQRASRWAGVEEGPALELPGLIGEFLEELIRASKGLGRPQGDESASPFQSALEVLEGDLLKGTVDFSRLEGSLVPEIVYRAQSKRRKIEIPIWRASSMAEELAPLVLWIKHLLNPREMLVIEEPEAHLHPESQRRVARALVRLARAGVTVLCTTHSPLILHQVSNHILASRADPARRKELGFTEEDLLREEEVGAYLFRMRRDERGSEIQPLRIELGFGVPEDEFVEVAEEIGAETYRLTGPLTIELGEEQGA
jgi:hypothetical protein